MAGTGDGVMVVVVVDDDNDVNVSRWICLSVAATSACKVPLAVTDVNTMVLREVVDGMLDDPSAMLLLLVVVLRLATCDWGGSYRMFEGEDGDVGHEGVMHTTSRCSPSPTPVATDKGERVDGDNINGDVEVEKRE